MGNISEKCKCPKLFEELDRRGMKQNDFAMLIGASTGNVSDWASGKSAPTRRRWVKISEMLGVPIEELTSTKKEPAGEGGIDSERMTSIMKKWEALPKENRELFEKQAEAILDVLSEGKKDGET